MTTTTTLMRRNALAPHRSAPTGPAADDAAEVRRSHAFRVFVAAVMLRVTIVLATMATAAVSAVVGRLRVLQTSPREQGAATAEYAIAMLAAVGFAGVLVVILRGDEVRGVLTNLVRNALNAAP